MAQLQDEVAYVTGGASGIGKAVVNMLVKHGVKVFIADRDTSSLETFVSELNKSSKVASFAHVDAADWKSQAKAFGQAVSEYGHIDHVYPIAGIGERRWLPIEQSSTGYEMPDLTVLDVDLYGVMYTIALAVQQFRRQEKGRGGIKGRIGCVASVCGIYCVPTLPIYTAAKHAITGLVRSYGHYLPSEGILLNSTNPNVVRTNISTGAFYDTLEEKNLLTPIEGVIKVFEDLLHDDQKSGSTFEVGPNWKEQGAVERVATEYLDDESKRVCELLEKRARPMQTSS